MNIGINGFGRIGRLTLRAALQKLSNSSFSVVNTSGAMDITGWAMLLKYDTAYGTLNEDITINKNSSSPQEIGSITVSGKKIVFLAERDPSKIPWKKYNVDIVIESTGVFRKREQAKLHLTAGAKRVIISAPAKDDTVKLVMRAINEHDAKGETIISNCSCTTYSSAPVIKPILDTFGIEKISLTTIHAYTSDQRLLDGSHKKDIRRARAAAQNIIPTTSGSAKAIIKLFPQLAGKFESSAVRVPVITGSLSDHTILLSKNATKEEINSVLTSAAQHEFKGVLKVTHDPIVSSDIIGNDASAIVDLSLTSVIHGNLAKIYSWYDNEWSYAVRLAELAVSLLK